MHSLLNNRWLWAGLLVALLYIGFNGILFHIPERFTFWDIKDSAIFNINIVITLTCAIFARGKNNRHLLALFLLAIALNWIAIGFVLNAFRGNVLLTSWGTAIPAGAFWLLFYYREYLGFKFSSITGLRLYKYFLPTSLAIIITQYAMANYIIELGAVAYRYVFIWLTDMHLSGSIWDYEYRMGWPHHYHLFKLMQDVITVHFLWRLIRQTRAEQGAPDFYRLHDTPRYLQNNH